MFSISDIENIKDNYDADAKIEKLRAEQDTTRREIEKAEREIEQGENRIKRLSRSLSAEERKARTRRLIERGAIIEAFIPNAETLTNDEIKSVIANAFIAAI